MTALQHCLPEHLFQHFLVTTSPTDDTGTWAIYGRTLLTRNGQPLAGCCSELGERVLTLPIYPPKPRRAVEVMDRDFCDSFDRARRRVAA